MSSLITDGVTSTEASFEVNIAAAAAAAASGDSNHQFEDKDCRHLVDTLTENDAFYSDVAAL